MKWDFWHDLKRKIYFWFIHVLFMINYVLILESYFVKYIQFLVSSSTFHVPTEIYYVRWVSLCWGILSVRSLRGFHTDGAGVKYRKLHSARSSVPPRDAAARRFSTIKRWLTITRVSGYVMDVTCSRINLPVELRLSVKFSYFDDRWMLVTLNQ